jgi:glycosyltransferase involved in cell wall biosynthesis
VEHAIRTLAGVVAMGLPARLWVVGGIQPAYQRQLEKLAAKLNVLDRLTFWGKVPEPQKRELLKRAHLLLACSVREGWGLMVTEANMVGTPAVVYDVPGLRDSTRTGVTGLVSAAAQPVALARAVKQLLCDPDTYARLRQAAWAQASALSWDQTARAFLAAVEGTLATTARPAAGEG